MAERARIVVLNTDSAAVKHQFVNLDFRSLHRLPVKLCPCQRGSVRAYMQWDSAAQDCFTDGANAAIEHQRERGGLSKPEQFCPGVSGELPACARGAAIRNGTLSSR